MPECRNGSEFQKLRKIFEIIKSIILNTRNQLSVVANAAAAHEELAMVKVLGLSLQ